MATLLDIVKKDATNVSVTLRIIDSTNGTPETGVVFNTSGIDLWYRREGAAKVSITEATLAALTTAHADGGFLHISDGEYRLDLPDAAEASGAKHVDVGGTVTGMVVIGGRIRLVDLDPDTVMRGTDDAATATNLATVDTVVDAIKVKTDNLPTDPADQSLIIAATDANLAAIAALNDISVADILTTALTESYAANGADPTLVQAILAIHQKIMAFAISGTVSSVKKLDGTTEAFVGTLDDDTNPTSDIRS